MSNINAQAFLEGYMQKVAENGQYEYATAATPLTNEQMKSLGEKGQAAYSTAMEQDRLNKFLTDKRVQDYGTTAGGAAIGGALGGMMGGDMASTLMGTALGGVVGWLAKYFFGDDINKAYQYAIDLNAKGKLKETINQLEKNKNTGDAPDNALTDQASDEVDKQDAQTKISNANGTETGPELLELQNAIKRNAELEASKQEADVQAAKADAHMDSATVNAQTPTVGYTPSTAVQNISLEQGQGTGYTEDEGMDLIEPVQQATAKVPGEDSWRPNIKTPGKPTAS